jgi:lipopolysaccharide/colanic/teichoic acid biosynthesis glycosyltransferase
MSTRGTTEAPERTSPPSPAPAAAPFAERDVRRKRPPALSFLLRMDTLRRVARAISLLALDLAAVFLAIVTALGLKAAARDQLDLSVAFNQAKDYLSFAFLVTALLFAKAGLYGDRAVRPGLSSIVAALFQVTVVTALYAVVSGQHFSSYYIFYGTLFFAVAYVSTFRYANVIGFVSLQPRPDNGLISLGTLEDLGDVVLAHRVDEVIIADPDFPQREAVELVDQCHQRGVTVRIAPSTMEILVHRAEFVPGQSVPLFELKPPVFEGFDYALKRSFDLIGSLLITLLISPFLLACALAIKVSSRGPVIYRSIRPGIGGSPFACFKFRTMYRDAHGQQSALEERNEATGALFKIRDDPRVTPVGRMLRRFSIDELPQLFNVIRGDMSLVGPRPLPQRDYDRLEDWHKKRYLVLPGITGLWQVSGRSDLDFDDLVRLDFLYLERWSVFLDLSILVKTVPAVLSRRGAF